MKKIIIVLSFILVVLFTPVFVYSADFGIAPAFKTLDFIPSSEQNFNVRIYNHLDSDVNFSISCSGEFCNYISFNNSLFSTPNSISNFNFGINFPDEMNKQSSLLKFYFTPTSTGKNMISGVLSLGFELTIYNKLFNQDFNYSFYTEDNAISLVINNLKSEQTKVHYSIDVYDDYNNLSVLSLSKYVLIKPNSKIILSKSLQNGEYKVKVNLNSTNTSFSLSKNIRIGNPRVEIKSYSIKEESGSVQSLSLKLLLSWNKPLKAYSELFLYNSSNSELVNEFKGELFDLLPGQRVTSKAFFEVPGEAGYRIRAVVHYQNSSTEKDINFRIKKTDNGYEVVFLNRILGFALIAFLVIVNIILLLKFLKSKKKAQSKVDQFIKIAESALLNNNLLEAKHAYYKIELLYKDLPDEKKKDYYNRILIIYNKITNFKS